MRGSWLRLTNGSLYLAEINEARRRNFRSMDALEFGRPLALGNGGQGGARRKIPAVKASSRVQAEKILPQEKRIMSIEKKSLINNMTATKKALIATTPSPIVSNKIAEKSSVSASKVAASKVAASKVAASKVAASKVAASKVAASKVAASKVAASKTLR
jgi:hypothetical protein